MGKVFLILKLSGPQPPLSGPFIVAANHESFLDPIVLQLAVRKRRFRYMVASSYYHSRSFNWFYSSQRCIPVERENFNRETMKVAFEVLRAGRPVGIFPQGSRMPPGELDGALRGVGFMARRAAVPVIPARIRGTGLALPRGARFFRPARISVTLGNPIPFDFSGKRVLGSEAITREIMERIREL